MLMEMKRSSWSQRIRKMLKPPRRLRPTSLGKFVIGFSIVLGVAAVNTGNNLLYLMLGCVFGLISASGILSERSMRQIHVQLKQTGPLWAGCAGWVHVHVENPKRMTAYLIEISFGERIQEKILFPTIPARSSKTKSVDITLPTRGTYDMHHYTVETRYPFDFYRRSYDVEIGKDLYVGPAPEIRGPEPLLAAGGNLGKQEWTLDQVRAYNAGDPLGRMHWKQTAARGEWMVRDGKQDGEDGVTYDLAACHTETDLENLCGWIHERARQGREVTVANGALKWTLGRQRTREEQNELMALAEFLATLELA